MHTLQWGKALVSKHKNGSYSKYTVQMKLERFEYIAGSVGLRL